MNIYTRFWLVAFIASALTGLAVIFLGTPKIKNKKIPWLGVLLLVFSVCAAGGFVMLGLLDKIGLDQTNFLYWLVPIVTAWYLGVTVYRQLLPRKDACASFEEKDRS